MQMKKFFSKLLNSVEDSFLKNHECVCCFREISDETKFMVCEKCKDDLEILAGGLCPVCGDKTNAAGGCINGCKSKKYAFSSNQSLFYYTGAAAKIVKNLKYGGNQYIAKNIAEMLAEKRDYFDGVDSILFVPSSKKRIKERGFNQSKLVATSLGKNFDIPVLDALVKTKETIHQAGGTQKERLENLKDSFAADEKFANEIKGKTVLIVDDVFTTGSTLNECAKAVKKLRPKVIKTMTFAKTKFNITAQPKNADDN